MERMVKMMMEIVMNGQCRRKIAMMRTSRNLNLPEVIDTILIIAPM